MATKLAYKPANIKYKRYNVWLQMKSKIAADRVLKRFSRKIRKEDAPRDASPQFAQLSTPEAPISMPTLSLAWRPLCLCGKIPPQYCATSGFSGPGSARRGAPFDLQNTGADFRVSFLQIGRDRQKFFIRLEY